MAQEKTPREKIIGPSAADLFAEPGRHAQGSIWMPASTAPTDEVLMEEGLLPYGNRDDGIVVALFADKTSERLLEIAAQPWVRVVFVADVI